ncbi:MAG: hypothetical protein OXC02_11220 [Rhodobacteraceae bacterium]|nr:hypothetical protein [Paracoccaceae bacterium]
MLSFENVFDSIENVCSRTESAAEEALKSAAKVVSQARAMKKAAQTGNITAIKRTKEKLKDSLKELEDKITAVQDWPYSDEEEQELFKHHYLDELKLATKEKGIELYKSDEALFCPPSIIRILPSEGAVLVNRKKISTVRPSYLAEVLLKSQNKSSGFNSNRFIESLYSVYSDIAKSELKELTDGARVLPLARIYKLMTALPGANRDYDKSDFARDLYLLDSDGPRQTRQGKTITLSASTGARRRSSDLFSYIGPNGKAVEYYGIKFN